MRKSYSLLGLLMIGAFVLLAGCWDRRELNDLSIAVGLGVDKKEDNVQVVVQVVNPGEVASKKEAGGYSPPVTTLKATEMTILEALRKLTVISPRKIYTSHLRILVIGEDLARQGIIKVLDGISRNHEVRSDFYLIVAKNTSAENILKILTPIEKIPANKMFSTLEMSEKAWAPTVKIQLDRFISDLSISTKDSVLTGVEIIGDEEVGQTKQNTERSLPYANLQYSGVALFKNGKLVDWLNEEESKGYNYIKGNVKNTVGRISCPKGGVIAVDVTRSKSNVIGKVVQGKPEIVVDLHVEENIGEVQCEIDLKKSENIQILEKTANEKLTRIMEAAIKKAKENQADIFGFGEAIEEADPKAWAALKKDWDTYFSDLDVTIKVDALLRRIGTIDNSLLESQE